MKRKMLFVLVLAAFIAVIGFSMVGCRTAYDILGVIVNSDEIGNSGDYGGGQTGGTPQTGGAPQTGSTPQTGQQVSALNGTWNGIHTFTINGSTGVYTRITNDAYHRDAISKGYLTVGGPAFRNITKTGDFTWSCQILEIRGNYRVATGAEWTDFVIVMSEDGKTFRHYWGRSPTGQYAEYTRQ